MHGLQGDLAVRDREGATQGGACSALPRKIKEGAINVTELHWAKPTMGPVESGGLPPIRDLAAALLVYSIGYLPSVPIAWHGKPCKASELPLGVGMTHKLL
jgi:hypothetical protein